MKLKMILKKCISFFKGVEWVEVEPKVGRKNTLTVYLYDSHRVTLSVDNWEGTHVREPWAAFFDWFEKESTENFFLEYRTGETLVKRSGIRSIKIETLTHEL